MTTYKELGFLCNKKFIQDKCIVLGNGLSVKNFIPNSSVFTIGVNDICNFYSPNVLLIVDTLSKFKRKNIKGRIENIRKGTPNFYVINDSSWKFPKEKTFKVKFGKYAKRHNLDNKNIIDIGLDSPYMGVQLAYKMGFKKIAILGVDYTLHHFYKKDGEHELVKFKKLASLNKLYKSLHDDLKKQGIIFYNLNKESNIKSIPFIKYDTFIEL